MYVIYHCELVVYFREIGLVRETGYALRRAGHIYTCLSRSLWNLKIDSHDFC